MQMGMGSGASVEELLAARDAAERRMRASQNGVRPLMPPADALSSGDPNLTIFAPATAPNCFLLSNEDFLALLSFDKREVPNVPIIHTVSAGSWHINYLKVPAFPGILRLSCGFAPSRRHGRCKIKRCAR